MQYALRENNISGRASLCSDSTEIKLTSYPEQLSVESTLFQNNQRVSFHVGQQMWLLTHAYYEDLPRFVDKLVLMFAFTFVHAADAFIQ